MSAIGRPIRLQAARSGPLAHRIGFPEAVIAVAATPLVANPQASARMPHKWKGTGKGVRGPPTAVAFRRIDEGYHFSAAASHRDRAVSPFRTGSRASDRGEYESSRSGRWHILALYSRVLPIHQPGGQ